MITEHIVKGSKETSFHNFEIAINEMTITISPGNYFQNGRELFKSDEVVILTAPLNGLYSVWVTNTGFQFDNEPVIQPIDKLAWFTATDMELTDVHFVKVVE